MRWTLAVAAACALAAATGACGSQITVGDQGIIVTGCQQPSQCFRTDCDCKRASVTASPDKGGCTVSCRIVTPNDPSTCDCLPVPSDDGGAAVDTQCIEPVQACIGRGPPCPGIGALCKPAMSACDGTGEPPMLIPTGSAPKLEPHCQFVDDVCCPGTDISDGGMSTD